MLPLAPLRPAIPCRNKYIHALEEEEVAHWIAWLPILPLLPLGSFRALQLGQCKECFKKQNNPELLPHLDALHTSLSTSSFFTFCPLQEELLTIVSYQGHY